VVGQEGAGGIASAIAAAASHTPAGDHQSVSVSGRFTSLKMGVRA